ncbi:TonB-dependent receptor [Compostibacter hankyongensis]|uniref:TonB-dependent receptor n=1 Tax=Compostibacter hankyongensis TaxID=1007089 RepID=A0ABP8FMA7_9BACT
MLYTAAHAQVPAGADQVHGKVVGTQTPPDPLVGVSVQVKGTDRGTVTDPNGHYEIKAGRGDTLVFSYVGYDAGEVAVQTNPEINMTMKTATSGLNEVVVVGYGTQKRMNVTGAISSISGDELQSSPAPNITNNLSGRLPGVIAVNPNGRPGEGSNFTIRGMGSLNDNSPLVVVDGVVRSDFSQIDPAEIASITILKDASAAVYGARAANGVFLITTKHGKTGSPEITYRADFGFQEPTLYPKVMSAYQYAKTHNDALINQGYDPSNPSQAPQFYTEKQLDDYRSGRDGSDWYALTFKNRSFVTHHNLTLSGGSQHIRYFASAGFVDQDGMYSGINFKRYNFRSNIDADISKNLTVTLQLDGRQEKSASPGYDANYIFFITKVQDPTRKAFNNDGTPRNTTGAHPWAMVHQSGYIQNTDNLFNGTLSFRQKLPFITQGLVLGGTASWHKEYDFDKKFFTPYTMYDEDESGNIIGTKVVDAPTYLNETYQQLYNSTFNLSLEYTGSFGKSNITGLLLAEQSDGGGDNLNGSKADFPSNIKDQLFASGSENQTISGYGILTDARQSIVGRFNYDYARKYLFEVAFRYDGSYKFPKGRRFGFFPDISAGWNISEEPFIRDNPGLAFISNLKLRASQGLLGNDRVSPFQYEELYTLQSGAGPVFGGVPQINAYYGVFPNPDITWEKTSISDIGLDGTLWDGQLGFEFDYFYKHTYDILWSQVRSVPSTFGRTLPSVNYAQMNDKGFELSLSHVHRIGKLQYQLKGMVSYAINKVVQIDDPPGAPDYVKQLGKPVGFRSGYKALGIFQTDEEAQQWYDGKEFGETAMAGDIRYEDVDGDGAITSNDQIVLSKNNGTPKIIFGLNIGASWKNFNLNMLIQGATMSNLMLTGRGRVMFSNSYFNTFTYLLDYWSKDNPDAKYPLSWVNSRSVNDRDSDIWLKKNGYGRLKSVELGYTFKGARLKDLGIDNLKVYLSGYNLLTVSQLKIFDPEAESGEGEYYPQQRMFNAGLNLSF